MEPDPLEPTPAQVEGYVASLKELDDAGYARRQAWNQVRLAGVRAATRPTEVQRSLELVFRLGSPPAIDGETDGVLLATSFRGPANAAFRAAANLWMPWLGKRFDADARMGENFLSADARLPFKAIWPSHNPRPLGDGRLAAFPFDTRIAPDELDGDRQVMKLDYDRRENPSFIVRNVLDELVEVVPGAYLGKMLVRRRPGALYRQTGWFALQQPGLE